MASAHHRRCSSRWLVLQRLCGTGRGAEGQVYAQRVREHLLSEKEKNDGEQNFAVEFKKPSKARSQDKACRFCQVVRGKEGLDYWHRRVVAGEQDQRDVVLYMTRRAGVSHHHLHGEVELEKNNGLQGSRRGWSIYRRS